MSIELWNIEIKEIKELYDRASSRTARTALSDASYSLQKKVRDEENRINSELKILTINGKSYQMPVSFGNWWGGDKYTITAVDDVFYALDETGKLDNDGSYHDTHYAWVPNEKKFTKLSVRTLGGDRFGDRYFAEAAHFKHPADPYPYQKRVVSPTNSSYKIHIDYILDKLGLNERIKANKRR